jgi:NAD(P)-dependent dehydrogenase (short-subunit alcohol dehydrogenase family)
VEEIVPALAGRAFASCGAWDAGESPAQPPGSNPTSPATRTSVVPQRKVEVAESEAEPTVALAALSLASESSSWITSVTLDVSGGRVLG